MPRGKSPQSIALIAAAKAVLNEIAPATVRGVCYQLFVRKVIPDMSKRSTSRVSQQLVYAREVGIVSWDDLVDETRPIETPSMWSNPKAYIRTVMNSYRQDRWQDQPERVMVISEKGTVGGILRPTLSRLGVQFQVYHGFGSATALHDLAEMCTESEKPLTLLYVGDHDPSGRQMSDVDIPERVARYGGVAHIERVAVTGPQIRGFGLETFPAKDKATDSRYRWFRRVHGDTCCELDAMNPNDLRAMVDAAIVEHLDGDAWNRAAVVEAAEQASLQSFIATYPGVGAT